MTVMTDALITGLDPENDHFWKVVGTGSIPLRRCCSCGTHIALPLPSCPECGADGLDEVIASGSGDLYSWVVVHYAWDADLAAQVPYVVGAIELDEGARLFARVEQVEPSALVPGLRLVATFPGEAGRPPIVFVPEVQS